AEDAAERFEGSREGNVYSRFSNPSVDAFGERLAVMEGGEACVATASGMSASLSTCLATLSSGDHILTSRTLFGSTSGLVTYSPARFGITVTYVEPDDLDAWAGAITPKTRMLFAETPSNPLMRLVDIAALAELARKR